MSINTTLTTGLAGVQAGIRRADAAAGRVPRDIDNAGALAADMIDQMAATHQVKMSANVVKVADAMLGTIIDVKA